MSAQDPKGGDLISSALAAAAATVAGAMLATRGKTRRPVPDNVDEIAIDRSLLAAIRETEWRMKAEVAALAPVDAASAFEGLDDVEVAVYLDQPALVSDTMDDGQPSASEAPKRAEQEPVSAPDDDAYRARVETKEAQVQDGSYFDLLEVASVASEAEIRAAYERLRSEFAAVRLVDSNDANLRARAEMLLSVLHEAYEVLLDPALRETYRSAIAGGVRVD
jgi:hypothetical protein